MTQRPNLAAVPLRSLTGLHGTFVLILAILAGVTLAVWRPFAEGNRGTLLSPGFDPDTVEVLVIVPYPDGKGPLAHYVEHLAWLPNIGKGSRPEDRDSNAWTNRYAVGYWLAGPDDDLTDMLRRLKGVFDPVDLPRAMAESERDVILREYDWRMGNNPDARAAEEMDAFLYEGNAIAASVIGTPEQIKAQSYDDAKAFHAATHRPERARLVVFGDVSQRQLADAMQDAGFPDLDARRDDSAPPRFALGAAGTRSFRYPDPNAAPRMTWRKVVALPEPVDFDLLEAQTALARDILDTNLPGGLAGPLRFDAFVVQSFGIEIAPVDESHVELIFWAEPDRGIGFAEMQAAFDAALAASAKGVPAATFARVRDRFEGFWPDWSDDDETARWMADHTLARVTALRDPRPEREIRQIDSLIDAAGIDAILAALAGPGRTAIALTGTDPNP